ncbi:glycoside hydrolase family 5 protein [Mixia osmundae IAM 14324]|uniref:glucan 1,3-beta-glucosidase n=1 Tax=Mixia osmundae (strain CBS 9802 / IAM 14324 / JCM 22182 / KY 12970) TaxID=764103 RepID=G7E6K5_MIXOS|nr:glycoside hydrolase family 5 protein [Mixia osmundae IAM 14324]KEI40378.1 glycoside hydrolase family 5 protein [Mixia osmundae IAM 14324]GAA98465.1 hypothetical protein E5Q_05151 [Mixia osmundae IAM 14324]
MIAQGVGIGNWLVLEPWMGGQALDDLEATDEYSMAQELGCTRDYFDRLQRHWDTWITEDDLRRFSNAGINVLRISVGFWAWGSFANEIMSGEPYLVDAQLPRLQGLIELAGRHSIYSVIDLHGLPGSQNGYGSSGRQGEKHFFEQAYFSKGVRTIQAVSNWMDQLPTATRSWIAGVDVANEPIVSVGSQKVDRHHWTHLDQLKQFYRACSRILSESQVNPVKQMMGHDAFIDDLTKNWSCPHPIWANEWSLGIPPSMETDEAQTMQWFQKLYNARARRYNRFAGGAFWAHKAEPDIDGYIYNVEWSLATLLRGGLKLL